MPLVDYHFYSITSWLLFFDIKALVDYHVWISEPKFPIDPSVRRTVAFFGNFGLEIQIGNQQVLGKTWVKKVIINKFSLGKK